MTDPAIIEAAARALKEDDDIQLWGIVGHEDYYPHIVRCVLAAATPLIRADVLEEAAKIMEDYDDFSVTEIAAVIRALKEQP